MENIKLEDNIEDICKEKRNIVKEMEILNQENLKFKSECEMTKTKDSITKKLEIKSKLRKISILTKKTCLIFLKVILLINVRNLKM